MNEWLLPRSVLIVDNASIHKVASICEMVEECSARLVYLPVYSPDFNPIELTFSKIKAWLSANHDWLDVELESRDATVYTSFWEAVHSISAEHARGWYKHCGYVG
jgi:hypothetical protein